MAVFTRRTTQKIDIVFVMALITLFAATSFTLVLIGAKQYRYVTTIMNENHANRTTSSYLAEKIRQQDAKDAISLCDLNGVTALSISAEENGIRYITYIYYHDGALRELVVTENSVFSLSSGQSIIEMEGLEFTLVNDALLRADISTIDGRTQVLYFPLHCSTGREDS